MMDLVYPRMAKGLRNQHPQSSLHVNHCQWALILALHLVYASDIALLAPMQLHDCVLDCE